MNLTAHNTIYTIGHSTHPIAIFLDMLQSFNIEMVVDIRSFPSSRKFPQYDKEQLKVSITDAGMEYIHMLDLGGRRKVEKDSKNDRWHNASFRGYADYMETAEFKNAVVDLEEIARKKTTVYMCAEAVWWRCHRSMVSDYLKAKGWNVMHIMAIGKATEHPYTSPAIVENGIVSYSDDA